MLKRFWREDEGILTFEWILLLTLLVIGVIGGVAGIRDAILHEAQGVVGAMVSLDQSYFVTAPLAMGVHAVSGSDGNVNCTSSASYSKFIDSGKYGTARITPANLMEYQNSAADSGTICALP